jgi:hypothetical protein
MSSVRPTLRRSSKRTLYPDDAELGEVVNVALARSWSTEDGSWRRVSIGLNWYDLVKLVGEGRVEGYHLAIVEEEVRIYDNDNSEMVLVEQYKVLEAQADILLWYQRVIEGYPKELAKAEIEKIKQRVPILK